MGGGGGKENHIKKEAPDDSEMPLRRDEKSRKVGRTFPDFQC